MVPAAIILGPDSGPSPIRFVANRDTFMLVVGEQDEEETSNKWWQIFLLQNGTEIVLKPQETLAERESVMMTV